MITVISYVLLEKFTVWSWYALLLPILTDIVIINKLGEN